MTHILVFNLLLFGVGAYALIAGGAPERAAALVFMIASPLSFLVLRNHSLHFEPKVVWVDIAALIALIVIALRANRFWPMYISALQLLTLAIHGVKVYQPELATWMWMAASGKLGYPVMILLAIGVMRHRERVARYGIDRPWSTITPSGSAT